MGNQLFTDLDSTIVNCTWLGACFVMSHYFILMAYNIRLIAIKEFGTVIHEFDPYFNYRAAEYLYKNGRVEFFKWFDYKSWYPLGRPVGTTIYPGMQFTASFIKKHIVGDSMTLNDVCCYIPAWFGVIASILVGSIAYECTLESDSNNEIIIMSLIKYFIDEGSSNTKNIRNGKSKHSQQQHLKKKMIKSNSNDSFATTKTNNCTSNNTNKNCYDVDNESRVFLIFASPATECAITAMGIMGMVPAHLTRSIGGGFDNECVAMSAMCLTFYFWVRSLRQSDGKSYSYGVATGISYFYMAATWGGYVFVLNMIGLHAAVLVLLGRFTTKVYLSYTLFYIVGTILAIQIPVVGLAPIKSLEQLGPCLVFLGYQLLQYCESSIRKKNIGRYDAWVFRLKVFLTASIIGSIVIFKCIPEGYFGPISTRVRGLFVEHSKTGNPLVDSVAEHQPADSSVYFRYLQYLCICSPIGALFCLIYFGNAASFVLLYAMVAYFFSHRMVRLILLLGPVASILSGIAIGRIMTWSFTQLWLEDEESPEIENADEKVNVTIEAKKKKKSAKKTSLKEIKSGTQNSDGKGTAATIAKRILAAIVIFLISMFAASFQNYCIKMSRALSNPSIITIGQRQDGSIVKIDDYREAYWWIRDYTPEDSRILAWWDYGYQITAIANRTTVADGNTWNHEHIALLGKILTTNVDEGYNIARHLADYVVVWAGGGGDDLAKSPHLARIANSVYRGLCPGDPTCREFGFMDHRGTPSAMMANSFLYQLHSHRLVEGIEVDPNQFEEVYKSKYGKVRIFKLMNVDEESKAWVADPRNLICDTPDSWFCRGQYPPALKQVLQQKKDFSQLQDFNNKRINDDELYQKQYFENINKPNDNQLRSLPDYERVNQLNDFLSHHPSESSDYEKESKVKEIFSQNSVSQHKRKAMSQKGTITITNAEIEAVNNIWEDTDETTDMWKLITSGNVKDLENALEANPVLAHIRSSDGRGPIFWAFEHRRQDMVKVLRRHGVGHNERDKDGLTPVDLLDK